MWVDFGNKFHEVCAEFHERSEWNSKKRVKLISEVHEHGVDSLIIPWCTKYYRKKKLEIRESHWVLYIETS